LSDDHHEISAMCDRVRETAGYDRTAAQRMAGVLVAMVSRHLSAEQQYLYPTVRATLPHGGDVADRELAADSGMLRLLHRLHRTPVGRPEFSETIDALTRHVRRHAGTASRELLSQLRELCGDNELIRLGNRVAIAREAAPTRPHPATPAIPPANKVLDPAIGVLDKLLDTLTRRATWPEDL